MAYLDCAGQNLIDTSGLRLDLSAYMNAGCDSGPDGKRSECNVDVSR